MQGANGTGCLGEACLRFRRTGNRCPDCMLSTVREPEPSTSPWCDDLRLTLPARLGEISIVEMVGSWPQENADKNLLLILREERLKRLFALMNRMQKVYIGSFRRDYEIPPEDPDLEAERDLYHFCGLWMLRLKPRETVKQLHARLLHALPPEPPTEDFLIRWALRELPGGLWDRASKRPRGMSISTVSPRFRDRNDYERSQKYLRGTIVEIGNRRYCPRGFTQCRLLRCRDYIGPDGVAISQRRCRFAVTLWTSPKETPVPKNGNPNLDSYFGRDSIVFQTAKAKHGWRCSSYEKQIKYWCRPKASAGDKRDLQEELIGHVYEKLHGYRGRDIPGRGIVKKWCSEYLINEFYTKKKDGVTGKRIRKPSTISYGDAPEFGEVLSYRREYGVEGKQRYGT